MNGRRPGCFDPVPVTRGSGGSEKGGKAGRLGPAARLGTRRAGPWSVTPPGPPPGASSNSGTSIATRARARARIRAPARVGLSQYSQVSRARSQGHGWRPFPDARTVVAAASLPAFKGFRPPGPSLPETGRGGETTPAGPRRARVPDGRRGPCRGRDRRQPGAPPAWAALAPKVSRPNLI